MKRFYSLLVIVFAGGCAHLGSLHPNADERTDLWTEAHQALAVEDFERAESAFARLTDEFPESAEGRESWFYRGTIHLAPENPEWDPTAAEEALRRYLALDSIRPRSITRRPEATVLLGIAAQLNLPPEQRVPGLQPETRIVTERVVAPARESRALQDEIERLRAELAARDAEIARQREELERIRKTLTGGGGQ